MENFKFVKEGNKWYIDLPKWTGSRESLEMVEGADTMLDIISLGKNELTLTISEYSFPNASYIDFIRETPEFGEGAWYIIDEYEGCPLHTPMNIWLCGVTKFVFGYFPKSIYFSKVS